MKTAMSLLTVLIVLTSLACGYRLGSPTLERGVGKSLGIAAFENESPLVGAGPTFTRQAREVFARQGGFRLVSPADADLILSGRILRVETPAATRRFGETGPQVGTYDLHVTVHLTLTDRTGEPRWEATLTERDDSFGAGSLGAMRANRDDALTRLARQMLERAYRQLGDVF